MAIDLETCSDARLVAHVAAALSTPREAPADSFVLHAPLELLARALLLPHVRPAARDGARRRLVQLADAYDASGDPHLGAGPIVAESPQQTAAALVSALGAGDLDDVDRLAAGLASMASAVELRRLLAPAVVASLAAAAHGSILLSLLPRVAPAGEVSAALIRGPARELGRYPDWRLRWFEEPGEPTNQSLVDALLEVPMLGPPGSSFIYPIMNQAEESGLAAKLLSGVTTGAVDADLTRRQLSRIAAWSMLQEPPDHAPYGWSHCLTMPQAVLTIADDADPRIAVAVAATHVVGFRAALGQRPIVPRYEPERPAGIDLSEGIAEGPQTAAAVAWHTDASQRDDVVTELASNASLRHDAHLVKYTLACLDAAAYDPDQRRLYLAAAAYLAGWWATNG